MFETEETEIPFKTKMYCLYRVTFGRYIILDTWREVLLFALCAFCMGIIIIDGIFF